jgi:hypothetical protein
MFIFLDNIAKLQSTIYIKLGITNVVRSRHNCEKETFAIEKYHNYARLEHSRRHYVCV